VDPRLDGFRRVVDGLRPGLSDAPEAVPNLDEGTAAQLLAHLLELACRAQHVGNIQIGRQYLQFIPRAWLLDHIQPAAEALIASRDDWEFRRLLELYELLDLTLLKALVSRGQSSDHDLVREAAQEFAARE
jgi:hypothetical protein